MKNETKETLLRLVCAESLESLDRHLMDAVVGGAKDVPGVNGYMTADKTLCDAVQAKNPWFKKLAPEHQAVGIKYCTDIGLIKK